MSRIRASTLTLFFSLTAHLPSAFAGLPVADVSVSVLVTPGTFAPLSDGVIELTMHNSGPDPAGTEYPGSLGNLIAQRAFLLSSPSQRPPYRVLPGATGCNVFGELVGPNVNMMWGYIWTYYYPTIPAGESRTCRIPIQFFEQPFESFDTSWRISTNPEDPNLNNNTVNYRFLAGVPSQQTQQVPALSDWAKLAVILGLMVLSTMALRNRAPLERAGH